MDLEELFELLESEGKNGRVKVSSSSHLFQLFLKFNFSEIILI